MTVMMNWSEFDVFCHCLKINHYDYCYSNFKTVNPQYSPPHAC